MTITVGIDAAEELLPVSARQQHLLPLDEREVLVFLLAVARQLNFVVVVYAVVADVPQADVAVCDRANGRNSPSTRQQQQFIPTGARNWQQLNLFDKKYASDERLSVFRVSSDQYMY